MVSFFRTAGKRIFTSNSSNQGYSLYSAVLWFQLDLKSRLHPYIDHRLHMIWRSLGLDFITYSSRSLSQLASTLPYLQPHILHLLLFVPRMVFLLLSDSFFLAFLSYFKHRITSWYWEVPFLISLTRTHSGKCSECFAPVRVVSNWGCHPMCVYGFVASSFYIIRPDRRPLIPFNGAWSLCSESKWKPKGM